MYVLEKVSGVTRPCAISPVYVEPCPPTDTLVEAPSRGVGEMAMKAFRCFDVTERGAKVAPLPKTVLRFLAVLLLCCGALFVAWDTGDAWLLRIVLSLVSLAGAASSEWEARSTIEFTEQGVLIRNGWRRKTIAWSRFDRFAVPTPRFG